MTAHGTVHDPGGFWHGAEIISVYTRAQALGDGTLVDVTETAAEAGWKYPVAMTRAAYEDVVEWTDEDDERKPGTGQSVAGRLWDVVYMGMWAARQAKGSTITIGLARVPREGAETRARSVTLTAVCGPGDTPEPVVTIMLPGED